MKTGTVVFESSLLSVPCVHLCASWSHGAPGLITLENIDEIKMDDIDEQRAKLLGASTDNLAAEYFEYLQSMRPIKAFVGGFHETRIENYESFAAAAFHRLFISTYILKDNSI